MSQLAPTVQALPAKRTGQYGPFARWLLRKLFGPVEFPAEAVGVDKQRRLRRLAVRWLIEHPELGACPLRFDVVSVVRGGDGVHVSHLRGAF